MLNFLRPLLFVFCMVFIAICPLAASLARDDVAPTPRKAPREPVARQVIAGSDNSVQLKRAVVYAKPNAKNNNSAANKRVGNAVASGAASAAAGVAASADKITGISVAASGNGASAVNASTENNAAGASLTEISRNEIAKTYGDSMNTAEASGALSGGQGSVAQSVSGKDIADMFMPLSLQQSAQQPGFLSQQQSGYEVADGGHKTFVERYQTIIAALLALLAASVLVVGNLIKQRCDHIRNMRGIAAALHGEMSAVRAICKAMLRRDRIAPLTWPRLRSTVFEAYVGSIGYLGSTLARQISAIYGYIQENSAYNDNADPNSVRRSVATLVRYIEEVLPVLTRVEKPKSILQKYSFSTFFFMPKVPAVSRQGLLSNNSATPDNNTITTSERIGDPKELSGALVVGDQFDVSAHNRSDSITEDKEYLPEYPSESHGASESKKHIKAENSIWKRLRSMLHKVYPSGKKADKKSDKNNVLDLESLGEEELASLLGITTAEEIVSKKPI